MYFLYMLYYYKKLIRKIMMFTPYILFRIFIIRSFGIAC